MTNIDWIYKSTVKNVFDPALGMFQFFYCCQNGSSYVEFVGHRSWSRVSVSTVYPSSGDRSDEME